MPREYEIEPFRAPVSLKIDYAAELNEQQFAAVTAVPGPALVIAGAGSGKTRTLTYRVAFLLEQGIPPERILLLTFTNKAAREMMRRVADILGADISSLWGGTFHSVANRILRRHAELMGLRPNFTILDREDARDLIKTCVDEAKIEVTATRFPKPDVLADIFSMAANTEKPILEVLRRDYPFFDELSKTIAELQSRYTARKLSGNAVDFDDLLVFWLRLLREFSDIREIYQRRFQFLLVDEYQDTNRIQSDLIDLLGARHQNVMVVGDDSQSIYSWRGAHFLNILEFPKRYPKAQTFRIEVNYRSTPEILAVANAAIKANEKQFAKLLTSAQPSGPKPWLVACGDGQEQAAFVAQRALQLRDEGIPLNEIAVLYRSHFHALEIQLELTRRNIPYSITSGIRFFEQAHIKDVAAFLKLAVNPSDELSFKRLLRLLPGIGGKTAEKLWHMFAKEFATLTPALSRPRGEGEVMHPPASHPAARAIPSSREDQNPIATALQRCAGSAPKKTAVAWAQFTATMAQLEPAEIHANPARMIQIVLEAVYEEHLQETYTNHRTRLEDLEQLGSFATRFPSVDEFLTQLALLANVESEEDRASRTDDEKVRLSTIHQAKGLEFTAVFVVMLCQGLFPSERSAKEPEDLEEERRLFYVAITRAKKELCLSYSLMRMTPGRDGDYRLLRSQFLSELPKSLVEEINAFSRRTYW